MPLKDVLIAANEAYYHGDGSDLDDDEYDALADFATSVGVSVSTETPPPSNSVWPVAQHYTDSAKITSVVRSASELADAVESGAVSVNGLMSPKYDGLSCELVYDSGTLTQAILRGDGSYGEDIFENIRKIPSVPVEMSGPVGIGKMSVWVEILISKNNLRALNELRESQGDKPYKSERGAVAYVRSAVCKTKYIELYSAVALRVSGASCPDANHWDRLKWLHQRSNGRFQIVELREAEFSDIWPYRSQLASGHKYRLDGVVWMNPDGALTKIKFDPTAAVTTVTAVVEQLGRTGVISPVVEFAPVNLSGATVRRATGHNAALLLSKTGIGIGAKILVSRRGDVIPHIEAVVEPAANGNLWTPSMQCPSCGHAARADGARIVCANDPSMCAGTSTGLLNKFVKYHDIKGLGPSILAVLNALGVTSPADLYSMTPEWLASVVVSGRVIGADAETIVQNIKAKSEMTWPELLASVGIPGCSTSVMSDIAKVFKNPEELLQAGVSDLSKVPNVGSKRAEVIDTFLDTRWGETIGPLLEVINLRSPKTYTLSGKVFCITLGLSVPRQQIESMITSNGGEVKSSVSSKTTHVVCNYPDEQTTKLARARELRLPIISELQLRAMIGDLEASSAIIDSPAPEAEF